jgi:hypothetical protein
VNPNGLQGAPGMGSACGQELHCQLRWKHRHWLSPKEQRVPLALSQKLNPGGWVDGQSPASLSDAASGSSAPSAASLSEPA